MSQRQRKEERTLTTKAVPDPAISFIRESLDNTRNYLRLICHDSLQLKNEICFIPRLVDESIFK